LVIKEFILMRILSSMYLFFVNQLASLRSFSRRVNEDFVEHEGLKLPIVRSNEDLHSIKDYLSSIQEQIEHLKSLNLINQSSTLLDFGCGQGRLLNGLLYMDFEVRKYIGLDTNKKSIKWCRSRLKSEKFPIKFVYLPSFNARYNKNADGLKKLPFKKDYFDLIFLNSVFSHMLSEDIIFYLKEFHNCLKEEGSIYLTAFVEQNVSDEVENPSNYLSENKGPLHRVRYNKEFFFEIIKKSGFEVIDFYHQHINRTKQSVLILEKSAIK
jgi:SAM-dependent methyltransferase